MLASVMVAKVKTEGGFDSTSANVTDTTILGWVNERYRQMCSESGWVRVPRQLTPTVALGTQYALADDVVDVRAVRVGTSRPYVRMSTEELWEAQAGVRFTSDGGGAFAPNFEADGDPVVEIWPASGGVTIDALCIIVPADLTTSPDVSPKVPPDFQERIVDGAISLGMLRIYDRQDAGQPYEARFVDAVQKLKRRSNTRVGSGPIRAKLAGVDF